MGTYIGLRQRQRQTGGRNPELHITKAGDRDLRRLLVLPAILDRQDALAALVAAPTTLDAVRAELGGILDLERLSTRASCGRANAP